MRAVSVITLCTALFFAGRVDAAFVSNMYVFGDSLSDNGNLFAATGGLAPDPTYYSPGRFQNGPSYAEDLWQGLGLPGALAPRIFAPIAPQGTNYAVGGARSRYHRNDLDPATGLPPSAGGAASPLSLLGQVGLYQTDSGGVADSDALYALWIGSNDVADMLTVAGAFGPSAVTPYFNQSIADVATALNGLVSSGARHLMVPNVPDIGLTPDVRALGGAVALQATQLTLAYNAAIDSVLAGLTGVPGIEITRFDTFSLMRQVTADPTAFGFSNVTDACLQNFFVVPPPSGTVSVCSDPSAYLYWDRFHPTAAAQSLLASAMLKAVVPVPAPLFMLFAGLMLLRKGATRRA